MLKLRAKISDGTIVFLGSPDIPPAPNLDGPVSELDFDGESNAALVADIGNNPTRYRLLAGVLRKDGVTVTLAPDSESEIVRKGANQTVADLTTYLGITGTPTNAQDLAFKRTVARAVRYLIRRAFGLA